jgi:hypothetical protein|nr:MAG TPA: hypothetical protein [Caudoviricetes sp.]
MKNLLLSAILFLPCLLVLNESETVIPNIIGLLYIVLTAYNLQTESGEKFAKSLKEEMNCLTDKILK